MKRVVVNTELQGGDIRPPHLLSKLRELTVSDTEKFFGDQKRFIEVPCPACLCEKAEHAFSKQGFQYLECRECQSVYVSPRPDPADLEEYYEESEANRFRLDHLSKQTGEARRMGVLRSRVSWIGQTFDEAGDHAHTDYADLGPVHPMLFEELGRLGTFDSIYSVNTPENWQADCIRAGAKIADSELREVGMVTVFEQLERQYDPEAFLRAAVKMLAQGGVLGLTTRSISGFDLQVLWGQAPYILVPDHMNLLSIEGLSILIDRIGCKMVELSTPGQLDLEIVQGALSENPDLTVPRFVNQVLKHCEGDDAFQLFLQQQRLSSHVRIAAVKRDSAK